MSDIETPVESPTDIPEEVPEVDPIQTIYEGQSESLSGRSTLTFSVGRHPDTGALHLRIVGNTGGGMWCDEWIPGSEIDAVVIGDPELTSRSFQVLKPGRSTNTAGFVMAAVKSMGLIRNNAENTRLHELVPTETFEKVVTALMDEESATTKTAGGKVGRRKAKEA
ncbi:MAG: hypothetical protein IPI51_12895 [Betaproteobacteria bacterium]|nr:hypothetical protein [Betaproteobacteria bacterium]MBK7516485.1 hypothetical protein [Betaproteobacteria bacterium]MBK8107670.1 hypothetical protein [Betaproteobacteria bacterium]